MPIRAIRGLRCLPDLSALFAFFAVNPPALRPVFPLTCPESRHRNTPEQRENQFGWKVEPTPLKTAAVKEELAYRLLAAFQEKRLRIDPDRKLTEDLRGIKKLINSFGNIRLDGSCDDSHCDRFWAKALRQHALSSNQGGIGAMVVW